MKYYVAVPWNYKWLSAGNKNLYVRYIKAYIKKSHPKLTPVKIEPRGEHLPDIVICIKK